MILLNLHETPFTEGNEKPKDWHRYPANPSAFGRRPDTLDVQSAGDGVTFAASGRYAHRAFGFWRRSLPGGCHFSCLHVGQANSVLAHGRKMSRGSYVKCRMSRCDPNLLNWFYTKHGPQEKVGSPEDAAKIKNDESFRDNMSEQLGEDAVNVCVKCGAGKHIDAANKGKFDMRFNFGELLRALGGAHFSYSGTLTVTCADDDPLQDSPWTWKGNITQRDDYVFLKGSPGRLVQAYDAAYYLQQNKNYQPFWDSQNWEDSFSSNAGEE
jgi:hypothetical protein